MALLKP